MLYPLPEEKMIDFNVKSRKGFTDKAAFELNLEDKKECKKQRDTVERASVLEPTARVLLRTCLHHSLQACRHLQHKEGPEHGALPALLFV